MNIWGFDSSHNSYTTLTQNCHLVHFTTFTQNVPYDASHNSCTTFTQNLTSDSSHNSYTTLTQNLTSDSSHNSYTTFTRNLTSDSSHNSYTTLTQNCHLVHFTTLTQTCHLVPFTTGAVDKRRLCNQEEHAFGSKRAQFLCRTSCSSKCKNCPVYRSE